MLGCLQHQHIGMCNNTALLGPFQSQTRIYISLSSMSAWPTLNIIRHVYGVHTHTHTHTQNQSLHPVHRYSIQGQSKKILNICDSAPVSRRRMLATVVLRSVDFKLYFDTSHITPLSMSYVALSERVFSVLGDFLQIEE